VTDELLVENLSLAELLSSIEVRQLHDAGTLDHETSAAQLAPLRKAG
jgi:hypothetical protein